MPDTTTDLAAAIHRQLPRVRAELAELVAYRSVFDARQFPPEECAGAAAWVAEALTDAGLATRLIPTDDGSTAVYAEAAGPAGAPTVLLYAHYDVQPPLSEADWDTPPFTLTEREDGRWYGRGAADCKGNIVAHLAALRALRDVDGALPVTVKVIVEGSEEQGTGGLEHAVEADPALLAADVIVIGDVGNFATGVPTATTALRGMALVEVAVSTLAGNLHSGAFGGAAPDALAALIRMLHSLWAADGTPAVAGLDATGHWDGVDYPAEQFREDAAVLDGVDLLGSAGVGDRLWARPSITVLGIDVPPVIGATASIQATARASVSLRVPPGTDVRNAQEALIAHLREAAPWGARVEITPHGSGEPFQADTEGPAYQALRAAMRDAYGQELTTAGMGGSIPLCATLRRVYPDAEFLLIGVEDPQARIHAVNESVAPREIERIALAEALLLGRMA